jgi:hypothetical protein
LDAQLANFNLFGNSIQLSSPLHVVFPLWVAWLYFLVRYYQYLRDMGDKGIEASYFNRLVVLAERKARKRAAEYLPIDLSAFKQPTRVRLEIGVLRLMSSQPPPWQFGVKGVAHIDELPSGTTYRTHVFDDDRFDLPERELRFAKVRSVWWVVVHTRLFTEYGLPLVVAALPVLRSAPTVGAVSSGCALKQEVVATTY